MRGARRLVAGAALVGLPFLALAGCRAGGDDPLALLPGRDEVEGVEPAGEARVLAGDALYNEIDGGAEVFLELGFERLVVAPYETDGAELELELYQMRDAAAAIGVYLLQCGREAPAPGLAERNTINRYQLQLVHGSAYLVVANPSGDEARLEAILALARALVDRLPAAPPLTLFDALPAEGRVMGSERVVRGPFTLERVYTLGEGDLLGFGGGVTAVAAEYRRDGGERATVLVADYPSPAAAAAAFANTVAHLDPYLEVVASEAERLVFRDYAGAHGELTVVGARLELRVEPAEAADGD